MIKICLLTIAFLLGCLPAFAEQDAGKILVSPHSGSATILSLVGVDSDRAVVRFRWELDDYIEACSREQSEGTPRQIAACAKEYAAIDGEKIIARKAFCGRLTVYTEFGNFSMINHHRSTVDYDGKSHCIVQGDWKDHITDQIVEPSSATNTSGINETLRILCPEQYYKIFQNCNAE